MYRKKINRNDQNPNFPDRVVLCCNFKMLIRIETEACNKTEINDDGEDEEDDDTTLLNS
ncbi:hypothetical protein DEO72_LG3g2876 [Vigna unguiculata]|uniref:Uncharacterized protein n=1 Tax=Vigna unguiculata TaxID=3917 RepID=A0A4D6LI37_VIGUN|nr:hypothetical protein DEO72_LG3g2876 [Vigna unguiculata]